MLREPFLLLRPDAPSRVLCFHESNYIPFLSFSLSLAFNPARQTAVPHSPILLHWHSLCSSLISVLHLRRRGEIWCDDFCEQNRVPLRATLHTPHLQLLLIHLLRNLSVLLSLGLYSMKWLLYKAWAANEHLTVSFCVQKAM